MNSELNTLRFANVPQRMNVEDLVAILEENEIATVCPSDVILVSWDYLTYEVELNVTEWHDTENVYKIIQNLLHDQYTLIDVKEHMFTVYKTVTQSTYESPQNTVVDRYLEYCKDEEERKWLVSYNLNSLLDEANRKTFAFDDEAFYY